MRALVRLNPILLAAIGAGPAVILVFIPTTGVAQFIVGGGVGGRRQTTTILTDAAPDGTDLATIATPSGTSARSAVGRVFDSRHDPGSAPAGPRPAPPVP